MNRNTKKELVGRVQERTILEQALQSDEAEMVAITGRRRVGKTFLVNTIYEGYIDFEVTGIQNTSKQKQLKNFAYQLSEFSGKPIEKQSDWLDAFIALIQYLKTKQGNGKQKSVVFLDELPWLATPKSGFLQGLSFFWNSWAVKQNIIVVICGSAASWMIQKVIDHKGGLHNRITKRIDLEPFNLKETEMYLKNRNIHLDRYQIIQLYMAMGGIPHYLKEIVRGKSAAQNIDAICFAKGGLLKKEFSRLYPALFKNAENHIAIIRALASKRQGLTRIELVKNAQLSDGGGINRVLDELIHSGFISSYYPYGKKKKNVLYRLTDEYSLFYLQFIEGTVNQGENIWQKLSQTQTYKSWSGYTFEGICLKHNPQIKRALSIGGVYSESSSFYQQGNQDMQGIQIDLLIDRNDHVINLFEIKFYNTFFVMTKTYAKSLQEKMAIFKAVTQTSKQIFVNLITTFGLLHNEHSIGLIDQILTLDDLFDN
ncbi:MAG: ATP-binding protein [Chitinophagales bacterium]